MSCAFCYSVIARNGIEELDFPVMREFVDANHRYIDSINYGTGENSLSAHWFELVKYVRAHYPKIHQALTTNGYLAPSLHNRQDADAVLAALDEVDLSLDYADPGRHSTIRGHPKAYQWAMETIDICQRAQIQTTLVILGIDDTLALGNLAAIFDLAWENDCFVRLNIYRPNHYQKLTPLSYSALKQAITFVIENHSVVSFSDPLFAAIISGEKSPDASGKTSLRILPDGSITPSTYLVTDRWRRAHIRDATLGNRSLVDRLSQGISTETFPDACSGCAYVNLCRGGAIDRRMIWYGTMNQRDPYCPRRNNDPLDSWRDLGNIHRVDGPSIHDGYLPTLIFAPGRVTVAQIPSHAQDHKRGKNADAIHG
jgi:radical SAM protein with 4Fe4S-binding SPASM domain